MTGPGADAFVLDVAALAPPSADAAAPAAVPLVDPPPPPAPEAPPPPDPRRTQAIASGVAWLFQLGVLALIDVAPKFRAFLGAVPLPPDVTDPLALMPHVVQFVHDSANAAAVKHNVRGLPYQDELVTVAAIGIGVGGLVVRQRVRAEQASKQPTEAQRASAVDAQAVEVPAATPPPPSGPTQPAPVVDAPTSEAAAA